MFSRILIANRGEIACRIIATCRRLGVATVAIYSDVDAGARHVRLADEARHIAAATARGSYLDIEGIIAAAQASGAQAIHPGYGFLAENPQFAAQIAAAGLTFIGPPVAAMQAMSSKATARELMLRAGVPVLPGYQGEEQGEERLREEAARIGYPVLIKAVAGGGGKGMRTVSAPQALAGALAACRREARASFADERVLLEKYLPAPRHIEVQVFADTHGHAVHLFERDCSAQRRHQKVVEEAPAPHLPAEVGARMAQAAVQAARAVGYTGAGTVEFLLGAEAGFFFIEMNTRIQVEHAVTELISGVDLVEWQLRVAAGEPLPLSQQQIRRAGHAIEARLYAELPDSGFLPSGGVLRRFELPAPGDTLRVESGVEAGERVGIEFDPLLAKLIVRAGTRTEAIAALQAALLRVRLVGVGNNLLFLRRLIGSATFREGRIDTEFIERRLEELIAPAPAAELPWALATAALWTLQREVAAADASRSPSPWQRSDGWRLNGLLTRELCFELCPSAAGSSPGSWSAASPIAVGYRPAGAWLTIGAESAAGHLTVIGADDFEVRWGEGARRVRLLEDGEALLIGLGVWEYRLRRREPLQTAPAAGSPETSLAAPMPGRIIAHLVDTGAAVTKGTALLVLEAMKMEHTLCAPADGTVRSYRAAVGAQVQEGAQLIEFEPRT